MYALIRRFSVLFFLFAGLGFAGSVSALCVQGSSCIRGTCPVNGCGYGLECRQITGGDQACVPIRGHEHLNPNCSSIDCGAARCGGIGGYPTCFGDQTNTYRTCSDTACPDGTECLDVPGRHAQCVPISCNTPNVCPADSSCTDTSNGPVCSAPTCDGVYCPTGSKCRVSDQGPMCEPVLTCANAECQTGYQCIDSDNGPSCQPVQPTCATVNCQTGTQCVDTQDGPTCEPVKESCATFTCYHGTQCQDTYAGPVCQLVPVIPGDLGQQIQNNFNHAINNIKATCLALGRTWNGTVCH